MTAFAALAACTTPVDETASARDALVTVLFAEADTGVGNPFYTNHGAAPQLPVNYDKMLVRFNDSELRDAVPSAEDLESATLVLTVLADCPTFSPTYVVYRMTAPWVEGSGLYGGGLGSRGETTGATAECAEDADIRDSDVACVGGAAPWKIYGATPPYAASPTATARCTPAPSLLSFDVTDDVRALRNGSGTSNYGWVVYGRHIAEVLPVIVATREYDCGSASPCPEAPRLVLRTTGGAVVVPPDPTPTQLDRSVTTGVLAANRFLIEGSAGVLPVQTGVTHLDEMRAAVIRGLVHRRFDGAAVGGVQVRVLHEDHLGVTATRGGGQFDMIVEGGADVVLVYEHPDYLPVQRLVHVPMNDYVWAPDVALTPRIDPTLTGAASKCSSVISAGAGTTYTANTGGVRPIHVYLPAGGVTAGGMSIDYRLCAAEYTLDEVAPGEDAMPADLPAASGYTMAVELEARNATNDLLVGALPTNPGAVWIENTMGFPLGAAVPSGSYDFGLGGGDVPRPAETQVTASC